MVITSSRMGWAGHVAYMGEMGMNIIVSIEARLRAGRPGFNS
jgi:hypothetical protein